MENYSSFFQLSSSSSETASAASCSSMSLNTGSSVNGFLGLMQEMEAPITENKRFVGSENGEEKIDFGKNKGAKKIKKEKYAFQTRSQVDILDDGYRWRKYGQKAVKNNKFPRSYYRCTHEGCNVKKQVQRLSGDEGIVVTTYEGIHSHAIQKSTDNFEHILTQMQIYTSV
ncbi:probable WRKY transcription factor 75 [Mercurialis annua]|uniref:probable WRKY transcription factor 75 n=1 Tax=Mercurialis annua TaxID=3986 RepID=UPI00215FB652|nr:probable WRKY transcription factor 75 [Mercurialis annua]